MKKIIGMMIGASMAIAVGATAATAEEEEAVSGIYKDRNNTLNVSASGFGITGVTSAKKDSSPCMMQISEASFSGSGKPADDLELNACPTKATRAAETAAFKQPGVFVRGLSVCLTDNLRHLKPVLAGVKLSGAKVEGGMVTPLESGAEVSFARRTCADWQEPVFCDDGQVATGLTVYFRQAKLTDFQVVGLGLVCQAPA